jgi:predicted GIY-YIG superfamily endonuclease
MRTNDGLFTGGRCIYLIATDNEILIKDCIFNGLSSLNLLNYFPNREGVYAFLKSDGEYRYIGSTNNIQERIKTHLGISKKYDNGNKQLKFDFFKSPKEYVIECAICDNKEFWEYSLIDGYKPIFNIQGKGNIFDGWDKTTLEGKNRGKIFIDENTEE